MGRFRVPFQLLCWLALATSSGARSVSNSITPEQRETLENLCHHYYKEEFLVSAEVLESGCQVECIFLSSSGSHGGLFFDSSVTKVHNLEEGFECNPDQMCSSGTCIPVEAQSSSGSAHVSVFNASVPHKDSKQEGEKSDAFAKIFIDDRFVAKTRTISDNSRPKWRQTFVLPSIKLDTVLQIALFDRDDNKDELIFPPVQVTIREVIESNGNNTIVCDPPDAEHYFCYRITWFPQVL